MKPLGFDMTALASPKPYPNDYVPDCPGASVRFTRADIKSEMAKGEKFHEAPKDLPEDGYGQVRVLCRNVVEQVVGTVTSRRQFYGLCRSCSRYEADNRATLRERQGVK